MMTSEAAEQGGYYLWRLMIDQRFQGRGFGKEAMLLLISRIKHSGNPQVLLLSHRKNNTEAGGFYSGLGFSYTGNDLGGGELEMSLKFD